MAGSAESHAYRGCTLSACQPFGPLHPSDRPFPYDEILHVVAVGTVGTESLLVEKPLDPAFEL